jgi:hypothetical protein
MTRGIAATLAFWLALAAGFAQQPAPMGSSTGRPMRQEPATPAPQSSPQPPQLSNEEIMARAEKTALATMNWDQSSTAGARAETQLIRRAEVKGKTLVDYRIKISGAPHDRQYTLMAWPVTINQPVAAMDGLVIATDGTVGCPADSTKSCAQRFKGGELHLTYAPSKGEIYRHALISEDHQARIFFSIIPDPLIVTDKACSLEVVRLSPQFELVIVRGKGFDPGEKVQFHTQSYQELHDLPVTANSRGEFQAHLTPAVKGRVAGTTAVTAAAKNCSPSISFDWGQQP